jgi:methylthioribose-1-phosphate isomerase
MWAVKETFKIAKKVFLNTDNSYQSVKALQEKADYILCSDLILNTVLRKEGRKYLKDNDIILTHCNAGSLSSSYGGHALGMIEEAVSEGMNITVISKETRPRSQGFKLTSWELIKAKVPLIIITDNMVSSAIKRYHITKIIVGADRVAKDGSLANKIGTHDLALLASNFKIPFYVATGYSTIDLHTKKGNEIPIEKRNRDEILFCYHVEAKYKKQNKLLSKKALTKWPPNNYLTNNANPNKGKITIYNPAFDITPPHLIKRFITDIGSFKPLNIKKLNTNIINNKVTNKINEWYT